MPQGRPLPAPDAAQPAPAPPRPPPVAPRPGLPESRVEHKAKTRSSSGTAFAVDNEDTWLTARHVVDGCDKVGLIYDSPEGKSVRPVRVRAVHMGADVAVIAGRATPRAPAVALARSLNGEVDAFHVGYPKGRRAALHSTYIGRSRMIGFGRFRNDEEVAVWGVVERFPKDLPGFAGISGGPVFSNDGRVIGISVAGSDRRGRIMASLPKSFWYVLEMTSHAQPGSGDIAFTPDNFRQVGEKLLDDYRVARVYCLVRKSS